MVRTRNKSHRSGVAAPSYRNGGAGQNHHEPSQQVEVQPSMYPSSFVHYVHSVHSWCSVHPERSQRQLDLRDILNKSRAHISEGSREVNAVKVARREAKNARRRAHLYDLEALRSQYEEDGKKIVDMEAQLAHDQEPRGGLSVTLFRGFIQTKTRLRPI